MRRLLLAVLAVLLLAGAGLLVAAPLSSAPTYSVGRVVQEVRLYPRAWVGRTVSVRALAQTLSWGAGPAGPAGQQGLLIDAPFSARFFMTPYGSRTLQLNAAGQMPALLLVGAMPAPSGARRLALWLASLPVIGHLFGPSPALAPDVYRVRVVGAGPCPSAFSGFCPIGVAAS